jgi:hypothetical protein
LHAQRKGRQKVTLNVMSKASKLRRRAAAAQAEANARNAQLSTGPRDTSHTRFSGLQHGLTSKQPIIPGEDLAEYQSFAQALTRELDAQTETEKLLADRIVAAAWRLRRFTRIEASFFNNRIEAYAEANPAGDPDTALANLFIDPAESARMRLFLRYQTAVQREDDTARREFDEARKNRQRQATAQPTALRTSTTPAAIGFVSYDASVPEPTTLACALRP